MAELFDRFEINRTPRWPLLSRLVALSVVLHGLFLVTVAYVPALQSIFYVAGSFAGVKIVDEDYDPTLVGQRATLINVKEPYQTLYYPTDYFGAPALPEGILAPDAMVVQQVQPPMPAPVIIRPPRERRVRPTPTPTPEAEPSPSPTPEVSETDEEKKKKAEDELNRIAQEADVLRPPAESQVNTRPLTDVLKTAKQMVASNEISLNDTIELTVEADRNDDGSLENYKWGEAKGDPEAFKLAEQFVNALSKSQALIFLKDTRHMMMSLKLDQQDVSVNIMSEADTEARAKIIARGYQMMIDYVRGNKKGTDEGEIFNNMNVVAEGKQVRMDFKISREVAGAMLAKVKTSE
jgi:hypothetical protein